MTVSAARSEGIQLDMSPGQVSRQTDTHTVQDVMPRPADFQGYAETADLLSASQKRSMGRCSSG